MTIAIDETKPSPSVFSPSLAAEALGTYTPSKAAALDWAYLNQPKLFSGLVTKLQPYLGLTPDERVAVGEPAAVLGFARTCSPSTSTTPRCTAPPPASSRG